MRKSSPPSFAICDPEDTLALHLNNGGIPSKETEQRKFNLLGVLAITATIISISSFVSLMFFTPVLLAMIINDVLFYSGMSLLSENNKG